MSAVLRPVLAFCFLLSPALAAVQIVVNDQQGNPLEDAVVELINPSALQFEQKKTEVKQQDLSFIPFVSAFQKGSSVDFPNMDKTRHHVYSFSPAKVFELKLYANKPEAPVLFDQAGIIALGCNIHDYMQAYIYIGDSQLLQVTDLKGQVQFPQLADGEYQLKLWHPWQNADWLPQQIQIKNGQMLSFQLAITAQEKPKKPKKALELLTNLKLYHFKESLMATVTLKGNPFQTTGDLPAVGSKAPDFTLTGAGLADVKLTDFAGQRLVLNIFPSVDTPTCATSVRTFNKALSSLSNTSVLCVSADLPFAQARFCGAEGLEQVKNGSSFRSSFGSDYGVAFATGPLTGLLSRAVVVIGTDGTVLYTEQVAETADEPSYEGALAALV